MMGGGCMFCGNCGKENSESSMFCSQCGNRLKGETPNQYTAVPVNNMYFNNIKPPRSQELIWTHIFSASVILLVAMSFIMNMGWFRFVFVITGMFIAHPIIYYMANIHSIKYFSEDKWLRIVMIIQNITYPLYHILLPDAGDIGGSYMFFGKIRFANLSGISLKLANKCTGLAFILMLVHLGCLIAQFVITYKIKGRVKNGKSNS